MEIFNCLNEIGFFDEPKKIQVIENGNYKDDYYGPYFLIPDVFNFSELTEDFFEKNIEDSKKLLVEFFELPIFFNTTLRYLNEEKEEINKLIYLISEFLEFNKRHYFIKTYKCPFTKEYKYLSSFNVDNFKENERVIMLMVSSGFEFALFYEILKRIMNLYNNSKIWFETIKDVKIDKNLYIEINKTSIENYLLQAFKVFCLMAKEGNVSLDYDLRKSLNDEELLKIAMLHASKIREGFKKCIKKRFYDKPYNSITLFDFPQIFKNFSKVIDKIEKNSKIFNTKLKDDTSID